MNLKDKALRSLAKKKHYTFFLIL